MTRVTTGFLPIAEIPTCEMKRGTSLGPSPAPAYKAPSSQHFVRTRFGVSSRPFIWLDYGGFLNEGKNHILSPREVERVLQRV